ncbi:putative ribonuclease H-like domain-containing protein [Tanacetum coccineum]|uniref:Ribonuclease H-like domain-containing protein n=1 Tax=Tanacetum coccineum TaxID=301880 RepID=A0ABQ4WPK2_9ASTR
MLVQVYVDDIIFGSTKSSMVKDFEELMQKEFKMSSMGELTFFLGLQVKQSNGGIFLSQDKYVKDILNKFDFRTIKPASTPIEAHKSLGKDEEGEDVDLQRFQVTPSDYAGDNHDRRSTSGGCQYLGRRLVSWQCKKQTIVAISSTEAEYVAAASCCAQSYIAHCENPVFHQRAKHIQIRLSLHSRLLMSKVSLMWQVFILMTMYRIDVPHIRAMVAGKKILISEETIRADLLFDDANGVDCFPKQVIWDTLRDIGYEGNLAQLTFSKPLFSPQWKYLIHVLLHCLSPKSTSWEQFGTNIASALVGLATNQKFVQLFLNKQLEGVDRPQDFMPSVTQPSKIFTFMRKHSPKFSCRITPLTPSRLEVVTALAAEEEHSTSPHSRAASSARDAQGTPTQSAAQASISQSTADVQGTVYLTRTASLQGTAATQGIYEAQEANSFSDKQLSSSRPSSETIQIPLQPDVKHHAFSGRKSNLRSKRNDEITKEDRAFSQIGGISGDTEELDLETTQSTARQGTITPRTLNFEDEAVEHSWFHTNSNHNNQSQGTDPKDKGKGILVEEPKKKKLTLQQIRALETTNDEEVARKIQAEWDAEEERKRFEELKKAKPKTTLRVKPTSLAQERNKMMNFLKGQGYKNLQKLKYPQMKELYDKVRESIKDSYKDFIPMGSEKERLWLQERNAKRLSRKRKATISEEQPFKKLKLRTETVDEIRNYLRVVDFEKCAQERESLEGISMITELQVIDSPDGEYLIIHRGNNQFRAFDTLWEILHILDRQDLYHLYRVVQDYYEHIPPTGLGLILLGDLTTIWETPETSGDDFWKNQEDWEIVRWRLNESSGVHTLELEDGTMIHMLAERRYPLSRELMIRMLEHGMEVEDEMRTAIT